MNKVIVPLPKDRWAGYPLPFEYVSTAFYDLSFREKPGGFLFELTLTPLPEPVRHTQAEYDNQDRLYQPWWEKAEAWGVIADGQLLAAVETCPDEWSNRMQVTELWVAEALRGQGFGHALLTRAKERTIREKRRAMILETQTCNTSAIGFYLYEGLRPIGLDTCCYSNRDAERREVRLNMGWFPPEE